MSRITSWCATTLLLVTAISLSNAQEETFTIQPIFGIQLWSTYTTGAQIWDGDANRYLAADDRINFEIHRTRWGIRGKAFKHFSYNLTTSIDFIGRDALSAVMGGTNSGAWPRYRLWHAYLRYSAPSHDWFHLTMGFFGPQVSRESITAALRSPSFDKSWSQNYIRRHLFGTGPGRTGGINIGGMSPTEDRNVAVSYNVGWFNPPFNRFGSQSQGIKASVITTYRLALHFGQPEFAAYSTGRKVNYFGKRRGLTLAWSGAFSGAHDFWTRNSGTGLDILANFDAFSLSGEWMLLQRTNGTDDYSAQSGFLRMSFNLDVDDRVLEPMITYMFFNGPTALTEQQMADQMAALSGEDSYWEISLHYYFNNNLRMSLAYTLRDGNAGDQGPGFAGNNYFFQGNVGPFQRGNYLGVGLIFVL